MENRKSSLLISFLVMGMILQASVAVAQEYNFTLNFEDRTLRGWTPEGRAFLYQPTFGDNPIARDSRQPSNHEGDYWIGTYEQYQGRPGQKPGGFQGDGPVGTLTSAYFLIPKGTLSFLIGGGSRFETRVELLIEDPIEGSIRVWYATGRDTETMHRESWDLTPHAGKTGRIRIVDESSGRWGHISADDFRFSSGPPAEDKPRPRIEPQPLKRFEVSPAIRGPRAIIDPEHREVIQGENAQFESRSSAYGAIIRETWSGPQGQSATGRRFAINTRGVEPGSYKIELTVTDRNKQTAKAVATLVIVPPQAPPEAPPKARYQVKISASPDVIEQGKSVTFIASLNREIRGAEFNFDFGDGRTSSWLREARIAHAYTVPGEYNAFVEVKGLREPTERSNIVKIRVMEPLPGLTLSLRPDSESPYVEERVLFRAVTSRPLPEARYQFNFGDTVVSDWTVNPEIEHSYGQEGRYQARALVQVNRERPIESSPVTIRVQRRPQIRYAVQLRPDKGQVQAHTAVKFSAALRPPDNEVEYNFLFGDGDESGWILPTESVHAYARPGEYSVRVVVRKNREVVAESEGTVITVLQPAAQEKETMAFLRVTPAVAMVGDTVKFTVAVEPPQQGLEYRIVFGDGSERAWDSHPVAEHVYTRAGGYHPYATIRLGQRLVAESPPAELEISAPLKPPPVPPTPLAGRVRTIVIIGAAAAIFTAGYLARRYRKVKKRRGLKEAVRTFQAEPHPAPGEQSIDSGQRLDLEYELQIRPVMDRGTQEIAPGGPLIADENHESTEEK